mmetsp:Transcript_13235/g.38981  ORF Transcript_13235/g.38981 Transcript_13235/m.38981 type:complete len:227 (+) Transcript_13235:466-1146(+)
MSLHVSSRETVARAASSGTDQRPATPTRKEPPRGALATPVCATAGRMARDSGSGWSPEAATARSTWERQSSSAGQCMTTVNSRRSGSFLSASVSPTSTSRQARSQPSSMEPSELTRTTRASRMASRTWFHDGSLRTVRTAVSPKRFDTRRANSAAGAVTLPMEMTKRWYRTPSPRRLITARVPAGATPARRRTSAAESCRPPRVRVPSASPEILASRRSHSAPGPM